MVDRSWNKILKGMNHLLTDVDEQNVEDEKKNFGGRRLSVWVCGITLLIFYR